MRFPRWSFLIGLVVAFSFLNTAASCQLPAKQQKQSPAGVYSLTAEYAPSELPKMQVVTSVPLPEVWKKMGSAGRVSCGKNGDLIFLLMPGELPDLTHEIAHVGANGAMLGYFDLRRTPGFEKAAIQQAAFDSAGRIVLLVWNLIATEVMSTNAEGHPHGTRFRMDHTRWVLTVDDNGKVLSKFSFRDSVVSGQQFALFKNGNVLVIGFVEAWAGGVIFSPEGRVLVEVKVPPPEDQQSEMSNERSAAPAATQVPPTGPLGGESAAAVRRPPRVHRTLIPFANGDGEIFLLDLGDQSSLLKVSADGTVGPWVKLAVPKDERAYVERIAGHRVLTSIAEAQRPAPGTIMKAPEWVPKAVFDTQSGALIETLLVSMHETGPVCYSESGMTAIRTPEGTLDTLVVK